MLPINNTRPHWRCRQVTARRGDQRQRCAEIDIDLGVEILAWHRVPGMPVLDRSIEHDNVEATESLDDLSYQR